MSNEASANGISQTSPTVAFRAPWSTRSEFSSRVIPTDSSETSRP
jgi:hypothetical protein